MDKKRKIIACGMMVLACAATAAFAESITFTGTVVPKDTHVVYAPIGGIVKTVYTAVGEKISEGDLIAELNTTKVYAETSGVVRGIFGNPGESAETVTQTYGGVMYIESESKYRISASTTNAYNSTSTKFVHVGEAVKLSCYSDGKHTGTGVITGVDGTDYTVEVQSGGFLVGETVNVYRDSVKSVNRVGRGTLSRTNPTAVTGTGSITAIHVEDGTEVQKGDLLFETLDGTFDGLYMSGNLLMADKDGIVAQLNIEQGGRVEKNAAISVLYPTDEMSIKGSVSEYDLNNIKIGDTVTIELLWNQDDDVSYSGTVSKISAIADSSTETSSQNQDVGSGTEENVYYTVYIDFTPDAQTRYGMTAVISTDEEDDEEAFSDTEETTEDTDEVMMESEENFEYANGDAERMGKRDRMPEGMEFPEGMDFSGEFSGKRN